MPNDCSGPPTVVSSPPFPLFGHQLTRLQTTNPDGQICKLYPCSTDPECSEGPVTPEADCLVVLDGEIIPLWYDVTIVTNNWINDNGADLKSQEKGCGDLLSWSANTINEQSPNESWTATNEFTFTLPLTIKAGCVERAIASAGGPSGLKCASEVSQWVWI
jgi:hypothetical protein